uniref:non-specific serine/threonine protein kinase n=1 Tax=Oryza meridionalis TaxID=40149 RepID=A0A0E0DRV1_9ORYZ
MSPPPPPARAPPVLRNELSRRTAVLGLRLWVLVGIAVGAAFLLLLAVISCHLAQARRRKPAAKRASSAAAAEPAPGGAAVPLSPATIPPVSKEIQEVAVHVGSLRHYLEAGATFLKEGGGVGGAVVDGDSLGGSTVYGSQRVHIEAGKGRRMVAYADGEVGPAAVGVGVGPEVSHLGWGHWYTLRELEEATAAFAPEHVVGEGGYGIVYRGVLADGCEVAVKNLLNNRRRGSSRWRWRQSAASATRISSGCSATARRELTVLLPDHSYLPTPILPFLACDLRILVYEYVDNGNLEQWLHGDVGPVSPLSWDIRMNIVLGTAKGITYLHEGLEPKVVHRDIKSSNILLDKRWNPKVSDFGLAKLLGSDSNYVTTRVMGTFGYVAPEYASTGMLNERSDVYSFGILIMEIISGRSPVDYARAPGEVNLVEWLKNMVSNRDYEAVLDPKLPEKPTSKALKKALLVALRCVDPDSQKRPKMGHVIHMLEVDDFPYREDRRTPRASPLDRTRTYAKPVMESGDEGTTTTAASTPSRLHESLR